MAVAPGQLVESWLASDPAVSARQNEGFATEGGVVLPELIGGGALSPQPPPPSSTAVAPPGRADDHQKMEWIAAPRQLPALHHVPTGRVVESRHGERSGSVDCR